MTNGFEQEPQGRTNVKPKALQRRTPSFLQWFYNLPLGYKQLIALIVAELTSIVGLSVGARWIITTGLRNQLLNQAKAEITVTESYINLKVEQTGLGFWSLSKAPAIISIAEIYANNRTLPAPNQEQIKQILQNEIKTRQIEYATLIGRDFRIIVNANRNRSGETFNPNNLIRQVFNNSKQIQANAIVRWFELAKESPYLPLGKAHQDALIRYTLTPVRAPGNSKVLAVLVSGDIVNGKLPLMAGILEDFRGGYSGIYARNPTGEFTLATSLDQGEAADIEQAKPNVALSDTSLLAAAAAPNGQIVTGRMVVGTQTYTMTAKAIPNLIIEEASGPQPVFSAQPVTILVRGTPETTLNKLLRQSLRQEEIVLLLALLVTGVWTLIFRRTITKPIEQLGRNAQEFAEGNRQVRAEVFSLDEVGQVAVIFNKMADSIVTSEKTLLEQAHYLKAEAERTQAANQAKSKFLAVMSHELRTPLNAILGFTQLINRDRSLSEEHQQHLGIISRSGEHLLKLINNVLDISKIEAGEITLNASSFDIYHLLNNLEEMLQIKARAKGLLLAFEFTPDLPQYVKTDESKLSQVLLNLLGNAIKFTKQGHVNLRVSLVDSYWLLAKEPIVSDDGKMTIHFEVEDTGPGIAPDELKKLFEPFEQTETGLKSMEGTGLGLSISQNFVQLMGGKIAVSSQPGVGSVFCFDIQVTPVHEPAEKINRSIGPNVSGLAPRQPTYRILVAEDNSMDRLLLVKLLSELGFDVREAQNGQEVLNVWKHWEPHLIWMDIQMPVLDGYEVTKQIKASLKGQATIVIALTANAFEEDRESSLLAGCNDFLPKPFKREELLAKLSQHLEVQYVYEDEKEEKSKNEDLPSLRFSLQSSLKIMPVMWLEQLYIAALQCNDHLVFELLTQIPEDNSSLAVALTNLAENFQFDKIIILVQEVQTF